MSRPIQIAVNGYWKRMFLALWERSVTVYKSVGPFLSNHLYLLGWGSVIFLLLLLGLFWKMRKSQFFLHLNQFFSQKKRVDQSEQIRVEFYWRFETLIGRGGLKRKGSETQREFGNRVANILISKVPSQREGHFRFSIHSIVDAFYQIRFGNLTLSVLERDRLEEYLTVLGQILEKEETG
ncbi:MAG: DUF4129 domain-containing protein [Thermoguttaceae bacterium]